jgi:RNA polymerase sigma-70 factor (ECF subfamily)
MTTLASPLPRDASRDARPFTKNSGDRSGEIASQSARQSRIVNMTDRETVLADLLRAALAGDHRAYGRFLAEITPVLRGIVRARGAQFGPDTQEDILQDILLSVHAKRHTWTTTSPVLPWLYAITRYKVIDAQRRRRHRTHDPLDPVIDQIAAEPHADDVSAAMAARDSAALIGQLDPRSARIVRAVSLDGDSTAEVGQRLSMTEGAVRVALHRAIKRLGIIARRDKS